MLNKLLQYAPVQILSALSVFALIALQTKLLALEEYGVLAIFMLIIEVVRSFSFQWINSSLLRLYPSRNKCEKVSYLTSSFSIIITLLFPAVLLIAGAIFFYDSFSLKILLLLTFLMFIKALYLFFLDLSRLDERLLRYRLASILQAVSAVICTFYLLNLSPLLESALYALILSYIFSLPILLIKVKISWFENNKLTKEIVSYGAPLMISGVMATLASRVDRLFISSEIGLIETGLYSGISNLLLGVISLVFVIVALPLYPELTKSIPDKALLKVLHQKYVNTLMLITLPACVGLCIVAEILIALFLTPSYLQYGTGLFYILTASVFLTNLRGHFFDHGLQFTLNTNIMPFITLFGLLLNIILLSIFLNDYGLYGAAWCSFITSVFTLIASMSMSIIKGYEFSLSVSLVKTLVATLAMLLILLFLKNQLQELDRFIQLILLISGGSLSYLSIQYILNFKGFQIGKVTR